MNNKDHFYKAFEDKFRGEKSVIKSRLEVYLPFIKALKDKHPDMLAVDLGCGRGEWLELLNENHIYCIGVDINTKMLQDSEVASHIELKNMDAIEFLRLQKKESFNLVTSFHFIEHISFDDLLTFMQEVYRTLKPGGLIIFETPNPENIIVGTSSFHLDPTHRKPIPPELLSFLTEYFGFKCSKIVRLQENEVNCEASQSTLKSVFAGISPDYSVVAIKESELENSAHFDKFFDKDYGVTLDMTVGAFDRRIAKNEELLKSELKRTKDEIFAVYNSRSWKMTKPFRKILFFLKQTYFLILNITKKYVTGQG